MSRETPTAPREAKMTHTPEPWELTGSGIVAVGQKDLIGKVFYDGNNNADANAARIVAAVNAVAGIPTEELTRLGLGGLAKIYADRNQSNA